MSACAIVERTAGSEIVLTSQGFYARCTSGCQWLSGIIYAKHKARAAATAHDEDPGREAAHAKAAGR